MVLFDINFASVEFVGLPTQYVMISLNFIASQPNLYNAADTTVAINGVYLYIYRYMYMLVSIRKYKKRTPFTLEKLPLFHSSLHEKKYKHMTSYIYFFFTLSISLENDAVCMPCKTNCHFFFLFEKPLVTYEEEKRTKASTDARNQSVGCLPLLLLFLYSLHFHCRTIKLFSTEVVLIKKS